MNVVRPLIKLQPGMLPLSIDPDAWGAKVSRLTGRDYNKDPPRGSAGIIFHNAPPRAAEGGAVPE